MPQKRMECFRLLLDHLAWIEQQFLSGIRDSRKTGSLWRMMRGVEGVRKSIHQSWLVKGLRLLCWGFKGVQEEILSEEASTLQIGSVAFPPGQCTSQQLHPCHRLFDQWVSCIWLSTIWWWNSCNGALGNVKYLLLSSLPGPLWPGVVAPDRVLSIDRIEMFAL